MPESDHQMEEPKDRRPLSLLDLPIEVMEKVLPHLGIEGHTLVRSASTALKELSNAYILRQHKCFEAAYQEKMGESDGSRRVMRHSTSYFNYENFESDLALCLNSFHEWRNLFFSETKQLCIFIVQFLSRLERPLTTVCAKENTEVRVRRLQYTMTLFDLLRKFQNFQLKGFGMSLFHWNVQVELGKTFFGIVDESHRLVDHKRRIDFMAILVEMLFHDSNNKNFCGQKVTEDTLYTFGVLPQSKSNQNPRLLLKFIVHADHSVIGVLHDVITGTGDPSKSLYLLPLSGCTIRLELKGQRGPKIVYYSDMSVNILGHDDLEV
ncbi:uncharacterized protein LOC108114048 isoform X2 [Drosophila eugracilis]|uniref:uncharacterized protein LOC108114048 isoform X2 n=1 Tax=Drosophila eugracilis TaxID=29029 RepID=UPI0007E84147|nr:uncharacterized protein LOC108114048 isoform X2 [Drosophila eugracilis]